MISQVARYTVPVGATLIFQGAVFADSVNRPNPAAVYAEPARSSQSCTTNKPKDCPEDTALEQFVMVARKEIGPYKDIASGHAVEAAKTVTFFYDKVMDNVCYLRTKAPQEVRIGTIVVGGLTGMLLGIRGGFFKKIFMGSLGASGGAYLAYPNESEKYSKKYTAIAYNFIAGTPTSSDKKCDSPVGKRQSEKRESIGNNKISGPPENLPVWLQCPPKLKERSYPAPSGVEILPLSIGGRNGGSGGKKLNCGQCGSAQDEKRKPNAPADCPMMKPRCPGSSDDPKSKGSDKSGGGGVLAKISSFFGKGDSKLVEACKKLQLQVPDEQIRRRDVFDTHLICRKDGYYSPFMTKVDCAGVDEECEEEEVIDEDEDCEEEEEEELEEEEDCEEEEEEDCEEETNGLIEIDGCQCTCECPDEQEEEEECVEDAEGECIIEESAECMDDSCKFFLDGTAKRECIIDEKLEGEDLGPVEAGPEEDDKNNCKAMSNFIIRVQAPFSECSTNETCEQILERLTKKTRQLYPEPAQPEPSKDVEITVKQISVEDPSCEPIPKPKKKCKKKDGKKEDSKKEPPVKPPKEDPCPPPTFTPPPPKPEPFIPPPASTPEPPKDPCPPRKESVSDSPPPAGACPQPEGVPCPPPNDSTPPPPETETKEEEAPKDEEPPPPPRNDCDMLSEVELLKKRLQDIRCGCKTVCPPTGSLPEREIPVWTPPTPPSCSRCGAKVRGDTEDCFLCSITRRMRSGDYEEGCPPLGNSSSFDATKILDAFKEDPAQCTPEYLPDGSIKYKGGMCIGLASKFLWHAAKKIQPGGFFSKFTGDCGLEERMKALTGSGDATDAFAIKNDENPSYSGGMLLAQCRDFLWRKAEETESKVTQKLPGPHENQQRWDFLSNRLHGDASQNLYFNGKCF
ncbi:hypothetical protein Ocin01_12729 [Orchesella cincta]|uniref:MICOS complex subunit n=1 Tax=Orchesella cincta TaxID=48709 RepID=A0A1D2MLT0_ORCCI|nr:hypothetical protein Ocin01_12729 [Orchesella cincta]